MKHTPAPWTTSAPSSYRVDTPTDFYFTQRWEGSAKPEHLVANAHLIAAAPELYAELEAMVETFSGYQGMELKLAKAVLAKARGEAQ